MISLEHSPLGGSGAHRWFACAGSFLLHRSLLENDDFEQVESEFAKLGTAAHELGALCLTEWREPYEFIGQTFGGYVAGAPDGISLDAVSVYVAECEKLWTPGDKGTVLIEKTLAHPEVHEHLRGTVDFGFWSPKRGLILRDYKNGEGVGVHAGGNKQLLYYAFLMALEYPWLKDGPRDLPANLGIVQPNFYGIFEEPDVWETTLGNVLDFGHDELLPRMTALVQTQDIDDSDFVLGGHCQFCPVLLECPRMQAAFQDYAEGTEFVEMLTDAELDRYYALRPYAKMFMSGLEKTVLHRLIGGKAAIPSAKLVEKQTRRVWKSGAEAALKSALGDHAFTAPELKTPAVIEKMSTRGKELATEWGYKPEANGLTVAGLDDPRPPAKPPTNAGVFKNFEQPVEGEGW